MTTGAIAKPALRWADMEDEDTVVEPPRAISIFESVPPPFRCSRLYVTFVDTFTTHAVAFNASDSVQYLRDQILAKFSILHRNQKITLYGRELMANNNATISSCNLRDESVVHVSDRHVITVYVKTTDWGTVNLSVPASLTIQTLKQRIEFFTGAKPETQRLTYNCWLLQNTHTLLDYNIHNEVFITLHVVKLAGGSNDYRLMIRHTFVYDMLTPVGDEEEEGAGDEAVLVPHPHKPV